MFDPRHFADVADALCRADGEVQPTEAAFRAAIGRFYYAVLLGVREYLYRSESGRVDRTESTHRWVISKLRDSAEAEAGLLKAELDRMRELRNTADYGDPMRDVGRTALRVAKSCRKALGHLDVLIRRHGRA